MGIYDRHYYRDVERKRTGLSALSGMTVNTWIIVLCVAVFVIDQMSPRTNPVFVPYTSDLPFEVQVQLGSSQYKVETTNDPRIHIVKDVSLRPPQEVGIIESASMPPLMRWLHFSTFTAIKGVEFWRFIGFQFLHGSLAHLLFNMVGLFFFGPIVEQHLGSKRYLAFYLLCGIFGAIMYLLLNLTGLLATLQFGEEVKIPGLLFNSMFTPLVGASAGIFGVLMAGAYLMPRAQVLLFFVLPMQFRTLAYVLVAVALYSVIMGGHNAGGEAGHLGGAIAGFYFIRRPHHLHGFFDFLGRADPTSHHYRKPKPRTKLRRPAKMSTQEIDRILDKINQEGLHRLTDEEKRILREASRRE